MTFPRHQFVSETQRALGTVSRIAVYDFDSYCTGGLSRCGYTELLILQYGSSCHLHTTGGRSYGSDDTQRPEH